MKKALRRLVELLRFTRAEYERDQARYFAVAMVYYAFVSVEPMLFLLVALLALSLRSSHFAAVEAQHVLRVVENSFGSDVARAIHERLDSLQDISLFAALFSLVGLMAGASVLFHELRVSFQNIWKH